jgi:hypothetical protein
MRLVAQFMFVMLVLTLTSCSNGDNAECFDHPDTFAWKLQGEAKASLREGATRSQVIQFCAQKHLAMVQDKPLVYCTAEAHRALSRCDVTLNFDFTNGGTLRSIGVEKPRIKNP